MLTLAGAASCDRGEPRAAETDNAATGVSKTAETPAADPEPAEPAEVANGGETPEQITERLLNATFRNPPGVEAVSGPAPVSLDPDLIDHGDIRPNTKHTGRMTMTNIGDRPLKILALRSTCACTVPGIQSDTIPPGESITVSLELDATSTTGLTERYVMALFEGYTQPTQLIAQANVNYGIRTKVRYEPPDQTRLAEIDLQAVDESEPFRVISANGAPPEFVGGFDPEADEPRTRYTIRQDLSMYAPDALPQWFLIETDHPTGALIDIPVPNYEMPPERRRHRFNISESRLNFGRMTPDQLHEARFRVVGGDLPEASAFVESLEWNNIEQCDVEILEIRNDEGGIEVRLGVRPKPGYSGVLFGTVTIGAMGDERDFDIMGRVVPGES